MQQNYSQLESALGELGIELDASEYHGGVCGSVCAGVAPSPAGEEGNDERERALLRQMRESCEADLADKSSGFTPLLPDEDAPLPDRVEALAYWCSGFLAGIGEAGTRLRDAAPEVREIVRDLSEISRADLSPGAERDEDEQAYAELVEYVRVGAQIVFLELRPKGDTSRPVLH